ncbi:hypothetical protein [Algoriphagus hitonicola]|uniref:Outer membrane insertion C-terminal signal n=1 Tax=Algoriphagus hitonicola TaxID=435880 RepID=A0A1I2SHS9_9BACT|nr:hypothetical protein [Algoriphagus hitonicola]SFG52344.1 hypothetical protein SAMN04487988_104289 [Algoriphagus hitonicola]
MKKGILLAFFSVVSFLAFSQTTVSFHQSNLPFIGVNTQLGERWIPELRVGTDNFVENLSLELVGNYMVKSDEDKQIYVGLGARVNFLDGLVVPLGINYYPFAKKDFGFHMEAAPIIAVNDGLLLRGSFGIRYRFLKE